ncbi:zinc finger protein 221-like [Toxorhynchites rutilus septentrionalis]|uniref:zinc finger protein 221-like n=1 Tax=Toxorhynchites rutilus septentrionalis TaxID=329112 RepID=UPI002479A25E|nr:zinc finger protein 221-like [Toxorhynchites rutilus septentrionalis]
MQEKLRQDCFIPGCSSQKGHIMFMSVHKCDGFQRWWSETGWVQQHRINRTIRKTTRVCEKHFEEKYIDRSYKMPRLFPDAWPTMCIEEPKPEETELFVPKPKRADGKAKSIDPRSEVDPKMYCRLCGNNDEGPMEGQLDLFRDGEFFLRLCLGEYFSRLDLPRGICNNCTVTVKSCLEFLRKCELTQHKLDVLFSPSGELNTEPECVLLNVEVEELKQEKQELDIKEEQFLGAENEHNHESDYIMAEVDLVEDMIVNSQPSNNSNEQCGSRNEINPDYTPTPPKNSLKNLSGRKLEFPQPKRRTKSAADSKPKQSRSTSGEGSRICPICGKTIAHKGKFTSHMKMHSDEKDYACNICGRQFIMRRELRMHIESLHEKKTFVCNICGIKCGWRKALQRHMKNKHSDESTFKHKCTYCGKAFLLPNQLRLHVMGHTGDRIRCEICGAGYRYNYMLTQHKIREHGMEIKGVKLHKNGNRSRKKAESKQVILSSGSSQ